MNGLEYIKSKQQNWAKRKNFVLVGGTIPDKGEKNYRNTINDNLFEPLTGQIQKQYNSGDGNELQDTKTRLAKMKALHSSSAIVVNVFQYWQDKDITHLAYACGLCNKENLHFKTVKFEEKFPVLPNSQTNPNIDVVIHCKNDCIYAIESKFTEPYSSFSHKGVQKKYFIDNSIWQNIPCIKQLAETICPDNTKFKHLDAAQLIKHILGLKKNHNKSGFRLLYLWYDVIGNDGVEHRKEIEQFAEIATKDNIKFSHITYQEIIMKLSEEFYSGNENYCDYLTERYL